MCPGCYLLSFDTYCRQCRQKLFDGAKVSPRLQFETLQAANLPSYQEKTKRLSISGVQLKYSLRLQGNELTLTDTGGQYILKPIPPSTLIARTDQAPENEHLTMQIAQQVYGINTAANALIYFKDGAPAYITRRFDVKPDGSKYLQEDMAQLSGRSLQNYGEHFKYEGSYEDIAVLIQRYVAASPLILEQFFRLILFNYLFSNGDAHLKNFSLIQTAMGDFTLTPAYDLMSTILHTPLESDMALDLYPNAMSSAFYHQYGCFGRSDFSHFASRIGLLPARAERIISQALIQQPAALALIERSFLDDSTRELYRQGVAERYRRMEKKP